MLPSGNGSGFINNMTNQQTNQPAISEHCQQSTSNQILPSTQVTIPNQNQQIFPTASYYIPLATQPNANMCPSNSIPTGNYHQQIHHLPPNSDEEEDDIPTSNKSAPWQLRRGTKRRKTHANSQQSYTEVDIQTSNRFAVLTNDTCNEDTVTQNAIEKTPKPPPIFIYDVINYPLMINQLNNIAEQEQYTTKSMANNVIKINCNTPDTYRTMITYMNENNIIYHSYQLKDERAYRVVIKHLHYSVDTKDITDELSRLGHRVRNIINAKNRKTKEPLNLFFVDLEPAVNNKEIYKIIMLQNKSILIEPPIKKKFIIQCTRCQLYGHSKAYCNRPYLCVKCGGEHNTTACKKSKMTPATCALCGGGHPANYKGCSYYYNLTHRNPSAGSNVRPTQQLPTTNYTQPSTLPTAFVDNRTYAQVAHANTANDTPHPATQTNNQDIPLTKFLDEFKSMFNQLLQQNSLVLNMLSTLISKLN